jgi:hypothetical protein
MDMLSFLEAIVEDDLTPQEVVATLGGGDQPRQMVRDEELLRRLLTRGLITVGRRKWPDVYLGEATLAELASGLRQTGELTPVHVVVSLTPRGRQQAQAHLERAWTRTRPERRQTRP